MNNDYLLTPYLDPITNGQRNYNNTHIRTRVIVENIIGIWKRRFPIMAYGCRLRIENTLPCIVATAVLHNLARLRGEQQPPIEEEVFGHRLQQAILQGEIPDIIQQNGRQDTRSVLVNNYFS